MVTYHKRQEQLHQSHRVSFDCLTIVPTLVTLLVSRYVLVYWLRSGYVCCQYPINILSEPYQHSINTYDDDVTDDEVGEMIRMVDRLLIPYQYTLLIPY